MNKFEYLCELAIDEALPNLAHVTNSNIDLNPTNCFNVKEFFFKLDKNVLFKNAKTNNKTEKGNNKRIEFRVDFVNTNKTIFIDAKQIKKTTNITDAVLGDIERAKTLKGVLWLVFFGEGYTEAVIKFLRKSKHDNVKFIIGAEELKKKLLKEVNKN